MGQEGPGLAGLVIGGLDSGRLEDVVLLTAAGLAIALLALKLWFSHDQRLRQAASRGYHQRDLAHYSPEGIEVPEDETVDPRTRPLAPTFVAPLPAGRRDRRHGRGIPTSPRAAGGTPYVRPTTAFGPLDPLATLPPPAFDPEEAERLRPAMAVPGAPAASPVDVPESDAWQAPGTGPDDEPEIGPEEIEEIPPPAGALPLLAAPPPPARRATAPPAVGTG